MMKISQFHIFFTLVFIIYSIGNLYIFFKGYSFVPRAGRVTYTIIFIPLAAAFIAAKFLEIKYSTVFSDILNITGGFWIAFLFYGFIFFFLSDILFLLFRLTGILQAENIPLYRKWAFILTLSFSSLLILGGFINAVSPVIKKYELSVPKQTDGISTMRIAAVSDIHLGSIIRKRSIRKLSAILKEINPDVVFLLGDIIDGELGSVLRGDLLKYFTGPGTKDGLYAITGNHEYIGGADRTIPYIESRGIRILKDEMIVLPGGIQVAGRLDRDSYRYLGKKRMPLGELIKNADSSFPLILLDHQPLQLDEAVKHGIDLQLSGHTHRGQLWPLNYVIDRIYEVGYGYRKKGDTHIIVSSGFGLWGPRVRTSGRSEVLRVDVKFTANRQK
ncbi:MAG: metallophosphoesterase [Bacteroidales bacterium]|jgi:predicted MPP superfamily phosphohydrolase|nr:metallophosphoesterase [Bacteroidales bacterium]